MSDPISIAISVTALTFTVGAWTHQHLWKVDSAVCTLVGHEYTDKQANFQFSIANLGNRPVLLRCLNVLVFPEPGPNRLGESNAAGNLPQVIKPGEMFAARVEVQWTTTFLTQAAKNSESRGVEGCELYFVVNTVLWNPKGTMMAGEMSLGRLRINHKLGIRSYDHPTETSFRCTKDAARGRLVHQSIADLSKMKEPARRES